MNNPSHIVLAILTAIEAGESILDVYRSNFSVEYKSDKSPLTIADKNSHEIIMNSLRAYNIPILSEEGKDSPYEQRKTWGRFWLVDPLDGTKEFIKRNGEFTVNIAMIEDNKPVLGVIFVPDKNTLYYATQQIGAYKLKHGPQIELLCTKSSDKGKNGVLLDQIIAQSTKLPVKSKKRSALTIVGSRSHKNRELEEFVEQKRREFGAVEFISAGSSLKICLVAEGKADLYPRLGPTMEWDTAAGQAIAENAGAKIYQYGIRQPLAYNKQDLHNPWFIVQREE